MNHIILNKPILFKDKYVVFLDSDNKFSFTNKRSARDFIVHIQKELDQSLLFITEELNVLEELFRLYYLADTDFRFKYLLSNSVDYIHNRLSWMQAHKGSENHDTILFQSVLRCIDELDQSFALMQKKAARRKDTITKRRCMLKIQIIDMYYDNLLSLGIKAQNELKINIANGKSAKDRKGI